LKDGTQELDNDVSAFNSGFDQANEGRKIFIIIVAIIPPIFLLLAFILLRLHYNRVLVIVLLILNFFVFLCILTYILHAVASTVGKDVCSEISYKNGMFDLFQEKAKNGIDLMTGILNSTINSTLDQGCSFFANKLCSNDDVKIWICEVPCNYQLFHIIAGETVTDSDGSEKTLSDCKTKCIDDTLRTGSNDVGGALELVPESDNLQDSVATIYNAIGSPDTRAALSAILCNELNNALYITYTGAGILLVGTLSGIIIIAYFRWKKSNRY